MLELSKAEKSVLEIKNEKMTILLEKKDVDEKLRDQNREIAEKEASTKQLALTEMKQLQANYEKQLKKLRFELDLARVELYEERKGQEENQRITNENMILISNDIASLRQQTSVYFTPSPLKTVS